MKKWMSIIGIASLIFCSIPLQSIGAAEAAVNAKPKVIPSLQEWTGGSGSYTMTDHSRIVLQSAGCNCDLSAAAKVFQDDLKEVTGSNISIVNNQPASSGDFVLAATSARDESIGDEGYTFEVGDFVKIKANTVKGVFYGTRTALQILEQDPLKSSIVKGIAKDFPKYQERGFMLDVARKFFPMSDLMEYAKMMSYYKLNDFQLHLNDNEIFSDTSRLNWNKYSAFRLESAKYPELTAKDGHYTKQDFRELQDLAGVRGLNITPEFESPSHALALTKVRPDLVKNNLPVDHLDITRPETIDFVKDVMDEYLDNQWFDSKEIHFGADEFDRNDKTTFEFYRQYLNQMNAYLKSKGKVSRMWGSLSLFTGTTPVDKDIVTHIWNNGWQNPADSVAQGFKVINTLDGYLYMVPKAGYYRDYLDTNWLYNNWEPTYFGNNLRLQDGEPNLLGGMFAVWNDLLGKKVSAADVHDRVTQAMPVMAEKMWRGQSSDSTYAEFKQLSDQLGIGPGNDLFHEVDSAGEKVVHYAFEEGNESAADQSGNSYNGTLKGAERTNEGRIGKGVKFNEKTDRIETGLTVKGFPWTAAAWVKLADSSSSDEMIFTESEYGMLKLKQKGSANAGFSREGYDFTFNAPIPTGRWVHVAFRGDLKGTSLFIDGELKSTVSETSLLPAATIGSKTASFLGALDEFKMYDRVLTGKEIGEEAGSPPWTVNVAAHKAATASSVEVSSFPANLAFDEDESKTSRWSSKYTDNEWIYVDLEQAHDIGKVILKWEASYAKGYKLQVSDDAQAWRDVYSTGAGIGGVEIVRFPAENARYVRMLGTKRIGQYGYSLYEFEVYPANPNDPVPVPVPVRYKQNFEEHALDGWKHAIGAGVGSMSLMDDPGNAGQHSLKLTANNISNVFVDENAPAIQNGEIEFKVTPQSDVIRAGIIFRYANEGSWASVGFDQRSWYWVNAQDSYGAMTSEQGAMLRKGETATVKVKFEGTFITLIVNGTTYFEGALPNLPVEAGKMGARVFGSTTAVFDDFQFNNHVAEVAVTGVKVDKPTIQLKKGETAQLIATVLPGSATNKKAAWASSDEAVAKVERVNGKTIVTAIGAGNADITVTTDSGGFTAVSKVTVVPNTEALSTSISAPSKVAYGEPFKVSVGLQSVTESVYAQDITIRYDANLMAFQSAESLIEGVALLEVKQGAGSVRLLMASQGAEHGITADAVIAELAFTAKKLDQPLIGTIAVSDAWMGTGSGEEFKAVTSSAEIGFEIQEPGLPGDMNGDNKVSIGDLAIVAASYGKTAADSDWEQAKRADVNKDGIVDIQDLAFVAQKMLE
jgi:uncharacterized protein YjdB